MGRSQHFLKMRCVNLFFETAYGGKGSEGMLGYYHGDNYFYYYRG